MLPARIVDNHYFFQSNPDQLRQVFPEVRHVHLNGKDFCAVPMSIDAARVLNNMGIAAPSSIRADYEFPGQYTPYAHQLDTADFLTLNKRAFCLNGMGTGKTLAALWGADYLMKKRDVGRVLIVSPLSTLERVWADAIFVNFPDRTCAVLHGSRQKRYDLLKQDHDFYIINHDGLEVVADELAKRTDIDLIILDESAVYRNSRTKRWQVLNKLITPDRQVWAMTGTPTPNEPTDAYGQMRLIKPENYTGSFTRFKNLTMRQLGTYRWIPRDGSEKLANMVLKPSIRFALADCIDLPETIMQDRQTTLSKEQLVHYTRLLREAVTEVDGAQVTAVNAAVLTSKLIQAACGVMYGNDNRVIEVDFGPRLDVLTEAIEECDEKVIVFVSLTGVLYALEREIKKHWTCAVIDGDVSPTKRNSIFTQFQHGKDLKVLIANPETMAHGLTLTAASTIIWYAPTYKNEIYNQANARIVRPGQKNVTNIINMYATTLERQVYAGLREKTRLQDIVLSLAKETI